MPLHRQASGLLACRLAAHTCLVPPSRWWHMVRSLTRIRREAQELLSYAVSLGLGVQEVEMVLLLADGDWEAAQRQLAEQVGA